MGTAMRQNEILTPSFTHDAGIAAVLGDIGADGLPNVTEHTGTACKVNAREIGVIENHITGFWSVCVYQIHNTIGQSRFFEDAHQHVGTINLRIGGLPNNHVAHHGRCCWQVTSDRGKVKGG